MTYADAVREIVREYRERLAAYAQREEDLRLSDKEFADSESMLRDFWLKNAKGEKIDEKKFAEEQRRNREIRARLSLVSPAPRCPRCGDTGRVNGKFCDCAVSRALRAQENEIGIELHDFSHVDYAVYGDKQEDYRKVFGQIQTICDKYPACKTRCIVLGGGTGIGKTYLAGCAAKRVLSRGMSVLALSAFAANQRFLKFHTDFNETKAGHLEPLLDCSLLVLDDLGTESILKNVTLEYLYQIVNERNRAGKLTLITTNLNSQQILTRYGERIYSRIFDKSLAYVKFLSGKDLRSAL